MEILMALITFQIFVYIIFFFAALQKVDNER